MVLVLLKLVTDQLLLAEDLANLEQTVQLNSLEIDVQIGIEASSRVQTREGVSMKQSDTCGRRA